MEKRTIKLEEIMPVIEEKLLSGGTVEIPITGTSMLPLLVEGRDSVILTAYKNKLSKYDLPLYRRADGKYVLHRVLKAENGVYTMCGDNQWVMEKGITDKQIIGVACEINRNGKSFRTDSGRYKAYCRIWKMLLPIRKYIVAIRGKLKK